MCLGRNSAVLAACAVNAQPGNCADQVFVPAHVVEVPMSRQYGNKLKAPPLNFRENLVGFGTIDHPALFRRIIDHEVRVII